MRIVGHCPACQADLFVDPHGRVICLAPRCETPHAAEILLREHTWHTHDVRITPDGFTVQHPLIERIKGTLMDCDLHVWLAEHVEEAPPPGIYRAGRRDEPGWWLEAIE